MTAVACGRKENPVSGGPSPSTSPSASERPQPAAPVEPPRPPLFAALPDCKVRKVELSRPKCWTLEKGDEDNFVKRAKGLTPGPNIHFNSALAVGNLIACVNQGERDPVLIGHGRPGLVCTGNGSGCWSSNLEKLSREDGNQQQWDGWFEQVKGMSTPPASIRIVACSTGKGTDGTSFLRKMADRFHCPVQAWTAFVWVDDTDIWLDPAGGWKTVTPGGADPPEPTAASPPPGGSDSPTLFSGGAGLDLTDRHLQFTEIKEVRTLDRQTPFDMPIDAASGDVMAQNGVSNPCYSAAASASVSEGIAVLEITSKALHKSKKSLPKVTKNFVILSDEMLQDHEYPALYYRMSPGFRSKLAEVLSRYLERSRLPP